MVESRARGYVNFKKARVGDKATIWKNGEKHFCTVIWKNDKGIQLRFDTLGDSKSHIVSFSANQIKLYSSFKIIENGIMKAKNRVLELNKRCNNLIFKCYIKERMNVKEF